MHTGGIDSGGAVSASGGFGGATHAGGAADAGGDGQSGAPDDGENTADAAVLPPLPHALYFSEYVEGSSSNKALEVAASERSSLNGCVIQTYFNGHSDVGASVTLTGELAANTVWTVCSSALASSLGAICAQTANLTFNGNDAIVLACDGTTIDVIGQLGFDPGTYWGTDDTRTADRTLRRLCSTTHGDIIADDAFDPAQEWQGYPIDSFDGLGSLNCDAQTDQ
jgi:predicted extracellular nuclease